jgi:hypothetical protein
LEYILPLSISSSRTAPLIFSRRCMANSSLYS